MSTSNNSEYTGSFKNGKRHGRGKLVFQDGKVYEGQFADDKISGIGTMKNPDGKIYEGQFLDGKMHGTGTVYTEGKESKAKKGIWEKGERVKWIKK